MHHPTTTLPAEGGPTGSTSGSPAWRESTPAASPPPQGLPPQCPPQPAAPPSRLASLDLLKAIGIFLVLIYHCRPPPPLASDFSLFGVLDYFFHSFLAICVPLFFFVNGALLLNRPMNVKKHYSKMLRVVVLGIVWGFITMFLLMQLRGVHYSAQETVRAVLVLKADWVNHLWFPAALVAVHSFAPLIKLTYDHSKPIFLYTLFILFVFTFGLNFAGKITQIADAPFVPQRLVSGYNIFSYHRSFALGYLIFGGLLYCYRKEIIGRQSFSPHNQNPETGVEDTTESVGSQNEQLCFRVLYRIPVSAIAAVLLSTLATTLYGLWCCKKDGVFYDTVFPEYGSIFTLVATLGVATLALSYSASGKLHEKLIAIVGANSLGIYFLHMIIRDPLRTLFKTLAIPENTGTNLLLASLLLITSLGACLLLKKIPIIRELFKT
jgi:surface polysaccharide O-acyltransferase-like enzyme